MKIFKALIAAACFVAAIPAFAGDVVPYTPQRFEQLSSGNGAVLVAAHASWCPTCKAQKPVIAAIMARPGYQAVTTLVIDYDADKASVRRHDVRMQSTLIAYRGGREVGRLVGESSPDSIEGLVRRTVD